MPSFYPAYTNPQYPKHAAELGPRFNPTSTQSAPSYGVPYADCHEKVRHEVGSGLSYPANRFHDRTSRQPAMPQAAGYRPTPFPPHDILPPIGAPMIPPLRPDDRYLASRPEFNYQQQNMYGAPYELEPKEEKVVGGVSATLDYDMEQMTDFVAATTVGMYELCASGIYIADIDIFRSIRPGCAMPLGFRKWVSQVLSATRLPSATLLLSLSYLGMRIRQLSTSSSFTPSDRALYQMLTIAMILGSKFLDDNTFQNKSWAEVSHISGAELNHDERDWLVAFDHRLHHDPRCADGFDTCEGLWNVFKQRNATSTALHPLDTNLQRQRSMNALTNQNFSRPYTKSPLSSVSLSSRFAERQYSTPTYSPYDPWSSRQRSHDNSPPTAPHSGPSTPEFYAGQNLWAPPSVDTFSYHPHIGYQLPYTPQSASFAAGWNTPKFPSTSQGFWNCHGSACQCSGCRQNQMMAPRYGPVVVG